CTRRKRCWNSWCSAKSASDPQELRMKALACLLLAALAVPAAAQPVGDFETRKGVEYATHDGVRLSGDLYLPKAAGPHPAIVAIHGGGWQAGAPVGYQYWGPYLAGRGYGVFAISYR